MQQRKIIPKDTELHLVPDGFDSNGITGYIPERSWVIGDVVGMGGSVICYIARCGRKSGKLKQFAPCEKNEGMEPIEWILSENGLKEKTESFLYPYKTLDRIRLEKPESRAINSYIPAFEVLYDLDRDQKTGVYIWLPDDRPGVTLEEYIKNAQKGNDQNGTKQNGKSENEVSKLYKFLDITLKLTEAVMGFHSVGLLHLDIKPSNILVSFGWEEDPDSSQVTMFDLDTITAMGKEKNVYKVTDGYSAPELYAGHADYRSDIYSVGACLYTSIMSDGDHLKTFNETYYEGERSDILSGDSQMLKQMHCIDNGCLILAVDRIIKRCVDYYPDKRYDSCEELASDIRKVKYSLLNELLETF